MFDLRVYRAHVVPARSDYGRFVVRAADPMAADRGSAFLATIEDPQPARAPNVRWAVDGDAARIESPVADDAATAYVAPARGGATMLHAYVGPPVNLQIDTPIFAYRSLFLGCAKRAVPIGTSFDADGASVAHESQTGSDLYASGVRCATQRRTALAIVAPRGATYVATRSLADFAAVSKTAWHAGGPVAFGFATFGTILERLRDGRILKFFMPPGARTTIDVPYELAAPGEDFADVRFLAAAQQPVVRSLPANVRVPSATPVPASTVARRVGRTERRSRNA